MIISAQVMLLAASTIVFGYVFWIRYSDHLARVAVAKPPAETDAERIRRYLVGSVGGMAALAILTLAVTVDRARVTQQWFYLIGLPLWCWGAAILWRFYARIRIVHSPVLARGELILGIQDDIIRIPRENIESVTQTDDQALGGQALVAVSSFYPGPAATIRMRDPIDGISTYLVVGDESEALLQQFQDHEGSVEAQASQ